MSSSGTPVRAANPLVPVDHDDFMARACRHLARRALLVLGRLFVRGNPEVDRRSLCLASTDLALFCWPFARTISRRFSYDEVPSRPFHSYRSRYRASKLQSRGEAKDWCQKHYLRARPFMK